MSLATLAKKVRAKRGVSRGNFALYMTSGGTCGSYSRVAVNQKGYGLLHKKKIKKCANYTLVQNQSPSSDHIKNKKNKNYCCETKKNKMKNCNCFYDIDRRTPYPKIKQMKNHLVWKKEVCSNDDYLIKLKNRHTCVCTGGN